MFSGMTPTSDAARISQIPDLPIAIVESLVEKLYNLKGFEYQLLKGYEDKNYRLKSNHSENGYRLRSHGYVLKITNERNSQIEGFIDAQVNLLKHLADFGLHCPEPQPDVNGNLCSLQILAYNGNSKELGQNHKHFVTLLSYIPGKMLSEISIEEKHMRQVGMLLARFHEASKYFRHPFYTQQKRTMWSLDGIQMVKSFIRYLPSEDQMRLIDFVIGKFVDKLASIKQSNVIARGVLHGDFNTNNLLVNELLAGSYDVEAFLDVGDSYYSYLVFDLAVAVTYILLDMESQSIFDTGYYVINEYQKIRPLHDEEKLLIFWSIGARLCQSLTYGYHAWILNPVPENLYVLQTQKNGWKILNDLLAIGEEKITKAWFK